MISLKPHFSQLVRACQYRWDSRRRRIYDRDLSFSAAANVFNTANGLHGYMHHYFHHLVPAEVRHHRYYFSENQRGFGEDAFHAMWWTLLREFHPEKCLEIGVYRGQVISLWALIGRRLQRPMSIHGISPFVSLGDAVSVYRDDIDYLADTRDSFEHFKLPPPILVKALSDDPVAVEHIVQGDWDLIYIDGGHDFEVALADYQLCRQYLRPGGLLILDDASLGSDYRPPRYSFAGHPGPSRIASQYAAFDLQCLGAVGHNNVFRKR